MPLSDYDSIYPNLCMRLRQTKAKSRIGQAYMLVGDDVNFLEKFAMAWMETAACQSPKPDGSPCGCCKSCTAFKNNAYPELFIVRPQSKSRQILVDDMRDFQYQMGLSATPGFLKIGMLVEAERLGDTAQNSFLKTLEEPPPGTMMLLLTVNPRKLLPTIKSRCQTIGLLQNKQDYSNLAQAGLFNTLSRIYRRAGASAGLRASAEISNLLAECETAAQENVKNIKNSVDDNIDDPKIRKQLEDEMLAKIQAEYVRRRDEITSAIQAYFLQRMLICSGADKSLLPHQEMLGDSDKISFTMDEASQDLKYVDEFLRAVSANVDIKLALDVMCLQISEKRL